MLTAYDVKLANRQKGGHFFDPDTMRFFRSRLSENVYEGPGGVFLVTSEQNHGWGGVYPRRYTVRVFCPATGDVDTAGPFNEMTRKLAHKLASKLAAGEIPMPIWSSSNVNTPDGPGHIADIRWERGAWLYTVRHSPEGASTSQVLGEYRAEVLEVTYSNAPEWARK